MIGLECFLLNKLNLGIILAGESPEGLKSLIENLPDWILILVLSGGRRHPEMKIEYEEEALREIVKEFSRTKIISSLPGSLGAERKLLWRLRSGWPADKAYWKFALQNSAKTFSS
jgi:hypothetical protein